jgi:hypothetical protein
MPAAMYQDSPCLGVVHVPKTGGVSLREALAELPGCYSGPLYFDEPYFGSPELVTAVPSPNRETIASQTDLTAIAQTHRLIVGHHSAPSLLAAGCGSIAIQVREPRSRLLSLYRYWQSQPEPVLASWGRWGSHLVGRAVLPLKDFLTSPGTWPAVNNLLVRQALGFRPGAGNVLRRHRAISRLYDGFREQVSVVDWSSRSGEFLERICDEVGASSRPTLGHLNPTEVLGEEQNLDPSTSRILRRLTRYDSLFLDRLCDDGLLSPRSQADLDQEFETTADRLAFRLV